MVTMSTVPSASLLSGSSRMSPEVLWETVISCALSRGSCRPADPDQLSSLRYVNSNSPAFSSRGWPGMALTLRRRSRSFSSRK